MAKLTHIAQCTLLLLGISLVSACDLFLATKEETQTIQNQSTETIDSEDQILSGVTSEWSRFQNAVVTQNRGEFAEFFVFPTEGNCLERVLKIMNTGKPTSKQDVAIHSAKMMTDPFTDLVKNTAVTDLKLNDANRSLYDLILIEQGQSFDGVDISYSTTYRFQVNGNKLVIVGVYCDD